MPRSVSPAHAAHERLAFRAPVGVIGAEPAAGIGRQRPDLVGEFLHGRGGVGALAGGGEQGEQHQVPARRRIPGRGRGGQLRAGRVAVQPGHRPGDHQAVAEPACPVTQRGPVAQDAGEQRGIGAGRAERGSQQPDEGLLGVGPPGVRPDADHARHGHARLTSIRQFSQASEPSGVASSAEG